MSKIFESFLLNRFSHLFCSDMLQFGFKKNISCSHAIFVLRKVIEYFNERDSTVYIASLDASKAFDRVNHCKLYSILIRKGLPKYLILVIINWYSKLSVVTRWNGHDSCTLNILSGVRRQGGRTFSRPIQFVC